MSPEADSSICPPCWVPGRPSVRLQKAINNEFHTDRVKTATLNNSHQAPNIAILCSGLLSLAIRLPCPVAFAFEIELCRLHAALIPDLTSLDYKVIPGPATGKLQVYGSQLHADGTVSFHTCTPPHCAGVPSPAEALFTTIDERISQPTGLPTSIGARSNSFCSLSTVPLAPFRGLSTRHSNYSIQSPLGGLTFTPVSMLRH